MSEPVSGGAPEGQTATPTPVAGTTTTTAPVNPTPPAEEFRLTKQEWMDFRREVRSKLDRQPAAAATTEPAKPTATAVPGDTGAMAAVEAMRFDLALEKALGAHKIAEDNPIRELIETAARATKPEDLRAYVARFVSTGAVAPIAPAVSAPIAPSNTGAPQSSPTGTQLPDNPLFWPADVVKKMSLEDYRKALGEYDARSGKGDPLRALRRRR